MLADPALVILDETTAEAESADDDRLNAAAQAAIAGRSALVAATRTVIPRRDCHRECRSGTCRPGRHVVSHRGS